MCDTFVALPRVTGDGAVWFGKNSDREPGEAQAVELWPGALFKRDAPLKTTHLELPQVERTHGAIISRPRWMWGAEMGVNEHGVAIGNEAVFTRLPVAHTGLTGMDLLRLALERSASAEDAVECITELMARHGQGGSCTRDGRMRYHSAFLIADATSAWVLETAGAHWAALRVTSFHTLSNALTIDQDFDRVSPGAFEDARRRGWCTSHRDFGFSRAFGAPILSRLSGARARQGCTYRKLAAAHREIDLETCVEVLTDHNGHEPREGWRMESPCAHASWVPTRRAGQTTASMIARLSPARSPQVWATGTSSPCISVFKPLGFDGPAVRPGPRPGAHYDGQSLFWLHEHLHRVVLRSYNHRRASFEAARVNLQRRAAEASTPAARQAVWDEHLEAIPTWIERASASPRALVRPLTELYWRRQSRLDRVPLDD